MRNWIFLRSAVSFYQVSSTLLSWLKTDSRKHAVSLKACRVCPKEGPEPTNVDIFLLFVLARCVDCALLLVITCDFLSRKKNQRLPSHVLF